MICIDAYRKHWFCMICSCTINLLNSADSNNQSPLIHGIDRVVKHLWISFSYHHSLDRCCLDKQVLCLSRKSLRKLDWTNIRPLPHSATTWKRKLGYQRLIGSEVCTGKHPLNHVFWRIHSIPTGLEESSSVRAEIYSGNDENATEDSREEPLPQPLRSNEVTRATNLFNIVNWAVNGKVTTLKFHIYNFHGPKSKSIFFVQLISEIIFVA